MTYFSALLAILYYLSTLKYHIYGLNLIHILHISSYSKARGWYFLGYIEYICFIGNNMYSYNRNNGVLKHDFETLWLNVELLLILMNTSLLHPRSRLLNVFNFYNLKLCMHLGTYVMVCLIYIKCIYLIYKTLEIFFTKYRKL